MALKAKANHGCKTQRYFHSKISGPYGCTKTLGKKLLFENFGVKRSYSRALKIKIRDGVPPLRQISTSLNEIPLLNPNKPDPSRTKLAAIEPIRPITLPRFPTGSSNLPSVTKVLSATMPAESAFILNKWKEAMIRKLGATGFAKYQQDTFQRGHMLHSLLANYLLGEGEPKVGDGELSTDIICNLWKSIHNVVREKISNVRLVEHIVTHPSMNYRGIVDCVAFYENELSVIDFKTAEKPKKSVGDLYDNPLQVSAYCGAINNDNNIPSHVIDRNISAAVVIVAYVDGSEASIYRLNREQILDNYWKEWTRRLEQFSKLADFKTEPKKKFNQLKPTM